MRAMEFLRTLRNKGYNAGEIMQLEKMAFAEATAAHEGMGHSEDYLRSIGREFVLDNLDMFNEYIGRNQNNMSKLITNIKKVLTT